jgi:hypothetical protein
VAFLAVVASTQLFDLRHAGATGNTIALNGPDQLGYTLQDVYHIDLSDPAPSGGLDVTLTSNDAVCVVAVTEHSVGAGTNTVHVDANRRRAAFVIQSVDTDDATCMVTPSAGSPWVGQPTNVLIVRPKLRLRELVRNTSPQAPDHGFFVETGVPTTNGNGLRRVQGLAKGSTPLTVKVSSTDIGAGKIVDRFGIDNPPPEYELGQIIAPYSRTVPGNLQFHPVGGGQTTVRAEDLGGVFLIDEKPVNVRGLSVSINGGDELGEGLQDTYIVRLSEPTAANLTVTISVPNTTQCAVATTEHAQGVSSITKVIPAGRSRVEFIVQGVAQTTPGVPCPVSVDAGLFLGDSLGIDIVQPALRIRSLPSTISQFAPNDPFFVDLGVPGPEGRTLKSVQQFRRGLVGETWNDLTVTCSSDQKAVATIVNVGGTDVDDDGQESAPVYRAFNRTVPGAMQLDPVGSNAMNPDVNITCSAAAAFHFIPDTHIVTVRPAAIEVRGSEELGLLLQDDYRLTLVNANGHGPVTIEVESITPSICLVGPTASSVPSNLITVHIDADGSIADFVINAADTAMASDVCKIEARDTAIPAQFEKGTKLVTLVESAIVIRRLDDTAKAGTGDDPFLVEIGIPRSNDSDLKTPQRLRRGMGDQPIKVCSNTPTYGTIVDETHTNNPPAMTDPAGESCEDDSIRQSFSTNVPGDLQFHAVANGGYTKVCVQSPGFRQIDKSCVDVRLGDDKVRVIALPELGSGLQEEARVRLTKPAGVGGVQVTVSTSDATRCLLANSPGLAGNAGPITVTIPEGNIEETFIVAALENLSDVKCTISATAAGFFPGEDTITVVTPGLRIVDLRRSIGSTVASVTFRVEIGVPSHPGQLRFVQAVRSIDGQAVPVTACSSNTTVGKIGTGCQTKNIDIGHSDVSFDFLVQGVEGKTVVTVSGPGGMMDSQPVRVAQSVINLLGSDYLGNGLQDDGELRLNTYGGATITLTASPADVCAIATSPNTVGATTQTFVLAANERRAHYFVQGISSYTCPVSSQCSCTLTATGSGIPDETKAITVIEARLRIVRLDGSIGARASVEPFSVEIGPANPKIEEVGSNRDNRYAILGAQSVRPSAVAAATDVYVRVCSSVPAAGLIVDPDNNMAGACADDYIRPGDSSTRDFGFDPQDDVPANNNVTVVDAVGTVPAFDIDPTKVRVEVTPVSLQIRGAGFIGEGLQDTYTIRLGQAAIGALNVTVTVDDTNRCKVGQVGSTIAGASGTLVVPIVDRESSAEILLFGLVPSDQFPCQVTAVAPGYRTDDEDVSVVPASLDIDKLAHSLSTLDDPDPFTIRTGARDPERPRSFFPQAVQADRDVKACVDNNNGAILGGTALPPAPAEICNKATISAGSGKTDAFSLKPQTTGRVNVSAKDAAALVKFLPDDQDVDIDAANIRLNLPNRLGAGLQDSAGLHLGHKAPTAVTVHLCADSAGNCELALTISANGAACIDVPIAQGDSSADFYVQGVEQHMGPCVISATASNTFDPATAMIDVVEPAHEIRELYGRFSTNDNPDQFVVRVGVPGPLGRRIVDEQALRANSRVGAVTGLRIVVCSSKYAVGEILGGSAAEPPTYPDLGMPKQCRKIDITQGDSRTEGFSFHPRGDGEADVYVYDVVPLPDNNANSFTSTDNSTRHVIVSDINLNIDGPDSLGVGLQDSYHVSLGQRAGDGGVQVTIETLTPANCKLAAERSTLTLNTPLIVTVPKGRFRTNFVVRGITDSGEENDCRLRATANGYRTDIEDFDVVTPAVVIRQLAYSQTVGKDPDRFTVAIGVPNRRLHGIHPDQEVAYGNSSVLVEACVPDLDTAIGTIAGGSDHIKPTKQAACQYTQIAPLSSSVDVFAFVAQGLGYTTVGVDCIDALGEVAPTICHTVEHSTRKVRVSQAAVRLDLPDPLGKGLQDSANFTLGTYAPAGGVTVTVTASAYCRLATAFTGADYDHLDIPVTAGDRRRPFVVRGVTAGPCTITATATGYVGDNDNIDVVDPGLAIKGLDTSQLAIARNDPFRVEVGPPRGDVCTRPCQPVALDAGLNVNVCSSYGYVGQIALNNVSADCQPVNIPKGQCDFEGLAFDPQNQGSTDVTATSPQAPADVDCSSIHVDVRAAALRLDTPSTVAVNLQQRAHASLSGIPASGTTISLTAAGSCVLSKTREGPPGPNPLVITLLAGRSGTDFWIEALPPEGYCIITATTSANGYNTPQAVIDVPNPGVSLSALDRTVRLSEVEPFNVDIGVANTRTVARQQEVRPQSAAYPLPLFQTIVRGVPLKVCSTNTTVGIIQGGDPDPGDARCRRGGVEQLNDSSDMFSFKAVGLDPPANNTTTVCIYEDGVPLLLPSDRCKDVRVDPKTIRITGHPKVGVDLVEHYFLDLSDSVTANTQFTVRAVNTGNCLVAANTSSAGVGDLLVTVLANKRRAELYVLGVAEDHCDLLVDPPAGSPFAQGSRTLDIERRADEIIELDHSLSTNSLPEPFNVKLGVARGDNYTDLIFDQCVRYGATVTVTACSSDVTVGTINSLPCVDVSLTAGACQTTDGTLQFVVTPTTATTTRSTEVSAATGSFITSETVYVSPTVLNMRGPREVGSYLEDAFKLRLSTFATSDTYIRVTSDTPSLCKVSSARTDVGTNTADILIPNRRWSGDFYVHGQDDQSGRCDLSFAQISGMPVSPGSGNTSIVDPAVRLRDVPSSIRTTGDDVPFFIEVGLPGSGLRYLRTTQERRAGATDVGFDVCSSYITAATVVGGQSNADATCRTARVSSNQTTSKASDADLKLHAVPNPSPTVTTITVNHPTEDFIAVDTASKDVRVSSGTMNIDPGSIDAIGVQLQDTFTLTINPRAPSGGLPVTIQSSTPSICTVSKSESTLPSSPYNTTISKGRTSTKFAIQGLALGTCTVNVTSTNLGYIGTELSINIEPAALRIRGLDATTYAAAPNDDFFIDIGLARGNNSDLRRTQAVLKGGSVTVWACSSDTNVGAILGGAATSLANCRSTTIGELKSSTASTAVKFDPVGCTNPLGCPTIADARSPVAFDPNLKTTQAGSIEVLVAPTSLSFAETNVDRVGAGLMDTFTVKASNTVASDATIHIKAEPTGVCQVAIDETALPANEIDVVIRQGTKTKNFAIHGKEGAHDACHLTASNAGFFSGFANYDIVQPAMRIDGLPSNKSVTAANDAFNVDVGIPKEDLSNLDNVQKVRIGSAGVSVEVCSSDTSYGSIVIGTSTAAACKTIVIAAGQSGTPTGSSTSFKLDAGPFAGDETVVEPTKPTPDWILTDAASVSVMVTSGNELAIENSGAAQIGSGLQQATYYVSRDTTSGTVLVTVESLTPTFCKVAATPASTGLDQITMSIASGNGGSAATTPFVIQALDNTFGNTCQVRATTAAYVPGLLNADIVKSAIRINNLATAIAYNTVNDLFNVEIGVADSTQTTLAAAQAIRYGGTALDFTVDNANALAAKLVGSDSGSVMVIGQSIAVRINAGQSANTSGALQRLELDPNETLTAAAGTRVSVSTANPDIILTTSTANGTAIDVTITYGGSCG